MPLPLTVLHVFAPLYYGQVGVEKAVPHSAHEIKAALEPALVEIVKKQPAHAPGLTAMPIVKIVIAPLLVAEIGRASCREEWRSRWWAEHERKKAREHGRE